MSTYHKDLPNSWIEIIEKDEVLKEFFTEYHSEFEAVPEYFVSAVKR